MSSFGISGTNAHVILEEAPAADAARARGQGPPGTAMPAAAAVLAAGAAAWLVSGRTAAGLAAQAGRLAACVAARPELDPADVGWSLATTRSVFEHRAVVTGADREELAAGLAAVAAGEPAAGVVTGAVRRAARARWCSCSRARAAQWAGMGRELAAASPGVRGAAGRVRRGAGAARGLGPGGGAGRGCGRAGLERADVVQPALWAVMVSLAAVWQAAGVTPDAVAGHSPGGDRGGDAWPGSCRWRTRRRVVALRSRALPALAGRGGMVSVAEPAGGGAGAAGARGAGGCRWRR